MQAIASPPIVKVISANGQISFGKQFAVRQVLVEKQETGVWLIRTATVISDNERWLHEAKAASDLAWAVTWSSKTQPRTHKPTPFWRLRPKASEADGLP